MAKGTGSHSEMARARQSDGLNVIFDQKSPRSSRSYSISRSVSRSSYDSSHSSGSHRGRDRPRRYYRSSSSSSSSSPRSRSSRSRSRSYPRCHRRSSRCRCDDHSRRNRGRSSHSPPRCYRAHTRSFRCSHRRRYRSPSRSRSISRSRSSSRRSRGRVSQYRCRFSQSPSRSRSRSVGRSVSLSLCDKRELLEAAKANAMKILGVEKMELPESVKPILSEPEREPEKRVRHCPEKTAAQGTEEEPDDVCSQRLSQKGKIAFSINNSVAKPTATAPPTARVTPRVDSVERRKPYGQWIPVRSGQSSSARKHT
ncbi:arginine/serine-rich protein 1 [Neolamprologus brichardi]|uniref:arginine/serine-rich protein 1 n=1 Tax=Neolamprologus brichardi TaxID=32507 RepID=UPI0003EC4D94|nr:arginine/serine-rich protein 1 [Neolamprologus brichardi]XP_006807549.1 arginine/serine-rich protein 1 [Neolamprologus brichardi]